MKNVLRSVLLPLGPDVVYKVIAANYPDLFPAYIKQNTNQKTNPPENEAG
jgi:hypothetical protein